MPIGVIGVGSNPYLTADAARSVLSGGAATRSTIAPSVTSASNVTQNSTVTGLESREAMRFGNVLTAAVDNVQAKDHQAAELSVKAVTGSLQDVHNYTIAANEAKLTMELTAAVRNRAIDSFNEIMRMQA